MPKLSEYKTKSLAKLLNYTPQNQKERLVMDSLVTKFQYLRPDKLANLLAYLHLALKDNELTKEFKEILRTIVPKPEEIDEMMEG